MGGQVPDREVESAKKMLTGELKKIMQIARKQGWKVRITGGGHVEWKPPDKSKPKIYSSKSMSDGARGYHNLRGTLRRSGLDI